MSCIALPRTQEDEEGEIAIDHLRRFTSSIALPICLDRISEQTAQPRSVEIAGHDKTLSQQGNGFLFYLKIKEEIFFFRNNHKF